MINIVTFKWQKNKTGYKLKNPIDYDSEHVNVLYNSIKRNTTLPFNFFCITDDNTGLSKDIKYIPLWDKCRYLGGCYNRLYIFSYDMRKLIGKRLFIIDLDCVIVSNIDEILQRSEDFIINEYRVPNSTIKQKYNGGLVMMNAGCRQQVWDDFDPAVTPKILDPYRNEKLLQGSDQAWIQYKLGLGESTFTNEEGIYDYKQVKNNLPFNASMIFFPGKQDPKIEKQNVSWINEHWR